MRTFGSDPELLITHKGVPKSAIGVVQGSPTNRITIDGHQFYYDNVLAECAIKPSKSREETLKHFKEALQIYSDMVKPFKLVVTACAEFPAWELEHEEAKTAGCAPDWCAYELALKDPPKEAIASGNLRSCGGHIHIGSDAMASDGPEPILGVLMLDLFLGVPFTWIDHDVNAAKRRQIYGQAGRYRTKDYGIEYRSLSNYWLNSPELTGFVYDVSMFVMDFVESGEAWKFWKFDLDKFFDADDPSEAWTCTGYNTSDLRAGINAGQKRYLLDHMGIVKKHLPANLRETMLYLSEAIPGNDINKNWDLK